MSRHSGFRKKLPPPIVEKSGPFFNTPESGDGLSPRVDLEWDDEKCVFVVVDDDGNEIGEFPQ